MAQPPCWTRCARRPRPGWRPPSRRPRPRRSTYCAACCTSTRTSASRQRRRCGTRTARRWARGSALGAQRAPGARVEAPRHGRLGGCNQPSSVLPARASHCMESRRSSLQGCSTCRPLQLHRHYLPPLPQFHNPHDEPVAPGTITIPIDDNTKVTPGDGQLGCTRMHPMMQAALLCEQQQQASSPVHLASHFSPSTATRRSPGFNAAGPAASSPKIQLLLLGLPPAPPACSTPSQSTATGCTWRLSSARRSCGGRRRSARRRGQPPDPSRAATARTMEAARRQGRRTAAAQPTLPPQRPCVNDTLLHSWWSSPTAQAPLSFSLIPDAPCLRLHSRGHSLPSLPAAFCACCFAFCPAITQTAAAPQPPALPPEPAPRCPPSCC